MSLMTRVGVVLCLLAMFAATANGQVVASSISASGTSFNFFSAQWTVPNFPVDAGESLFFYNALEGGAGILRTVLQFNGVGFSGWSVFSEHKDLSSDVATTPVSVQPGDTITSVIANVSGTWSVSAYINGVITATTSVSQASFAFGAALTTAQWVLAEENAGNCAVYPRCNQLTLGNIYLQDQGVTVTPVWSASAANSTACNASGVVTSPSSITLTWQSGGSDQGPTRVLPGVIGVDLGYGPTYPLRFVFSAVECASLCDVTNFCLVWAFNTTSTLGSNCLLHSFANPNDSVVSPSTISGLLQSQPNQLNLSMTGGDLPGMPLVLPAGSTAATCATYCQGNGGCVAWTLDTNSLECWLKASTGLAAFGAGMITGVKGALYTEYPGGDLRSVVLAAGSPPEDCSALCQDSPDCTGWGMTLPNLNCPNFQTCWLKTGTLSQPINNVCMTSSALVRS